MSLQVAARVLAPTRHPTIPAVAVGATKYGGCPDARASNNNNNTAMVVVVVEGGPLPPNAATTIAATGVPITKQSMAIQNTTKRDNYYHLQTLKHHPHNLFPHLPVYATWATPAMPMRHCSVSSPPHCHMHCSMRRMHILYDDIPLIANC